MIVTKINSDNIHKTFIVPLFESDQIIDTVKLIAEKIGFDNWQLLEHFKGSSKEQLLYVGNSKVYFLGLGKKREQSLTTKVFRSFFFNQKAKLNDHLSIILDHDNLGEFAGAMANGVFLAQYNLGMLKTNQKIENEWFSGDFELNFISKNLKNKELVKGQMLAETQLKIMRLVDSPANYKTPQMLSEEIERMGEKSGFKVTVFDEKKCQEVGLHALLAVGKGSIENPVRFVVMEYSHPKASTKIGLIGKGVTFDTGGVSLKPGDRKSVV